MDYPILGKWCALTRRLQQATELVRVVIVGKYTKLNDAYLSLLKALRHASIYVNVKVQIDLVDAEHLEDRTNQSNPDAFHQAWLTLSSGHAVVVPGGFGARGLAGKLAAVQFCRTRGVPFLGLCLGLQCAVIEFARNVLGWQDANSAEMDPDSKHLVVIDMPEFNPGDKGGTMRLGRRRTALSISDTSTAYLHRVYGTRESNDLPISGVGDTAKEPTSSLSIVHRLLRSTYVDERHRHRFEINPEFVNDLESAGLAIVGKDMDHGNRMEIIELMTPFSPILPNSPSSSQTPTRHPFFVGTQFHPEYTSRPAHPSSFFVGFIYAACGRLELFLQQPLRLSPSTLLMDPPVNGLMQNGLTHGINTVEPMPNETINSSETAIDSCDLNNVTKRVADFTIC